MTTTDASALKKSLGQLDVQRKSLEMEGEAIISELTAKPERGGDPMGIDTPLVDREGYPRGDIDVYRARDLRHRLAIIKTDRKELMKQIDDLLEKLALVQLMLVVSPFGTFGDPPLRHTHQNPKKSEEETKEQAARSCPKPKPKYDAKTGKWVVKNWDGTISGVENGQNRSFENLNSDSITASNSAVPTNTFEQMDIDNNHQRSSSPPTATTTPITTTAPFAKIDGVANLSPAWEAGLKEGDLVTEFGPINHSNHQNLRGLMPVVASAADAQQPITITLLRQVGGGGHNTTEEVVRLGLVPKPWPGRGLIGCHIVPYTPSENSN